MKSLLFVGLMLSCAVSFAGGFRIALEGRPYNVDCKEIQVPPNVEIIGQDKYRVIGGLTPLTEKWQRYEISFIPDGRTVTLELSGTSLNEWVAFDDFKVTNAVLYNPSFEIINEDKEIDGWCYYARECLQSGDAFDGKNFLICSRDSFYVYKDLTDMVPGRRVTISFAARKVAEPPVLSVRKWRSGAIRKVK